MLTLISRPKLQYTCKCGAVSEAEEYEFRKENTIPPRFHGTCAFCKADVVCFPVALVVKDAVAFANTLYGK